MGWEVAVLLRFRVANHRSIQDEVELSMVSSALRTVIPPGGNWIDVTIRVAAVYGANASGKSNLLDSLDFATEAVRHSATTWAERKRFPYHPFRLNAESKERPSLYEFSVVVDGVRYDYGFTSNAEGVQSEWLYSYPEGRRRRLFVRAGPAGDSVWFNRTLPGDNALLSSLLRPRGLLLSTAANANHKMLGAIHDRLTTPTRYAGHSEPARLRRMQVLRDALEIPEVARQLEALLRVADVGISGIGLRENEIPADVRSALKKIVELGEYGLIAEDDSSLVIMADPSLTFLHSVGSDRLFEISEDEQSSGTLAWISLAVLALVVFELGGVLVVDELDASLHPYLSAALVAMFKRADINPRGGQLIFTTHDVTLMSPPVGSALGADEVWFTEKTQAGATELFALAEYRTRQADNFSKRYLDGRYGAVPIVDIDDLAEVLGRA